MKRTPPYPTAKSSSAKPISAKLNSSQAKAPHPQKREHIGSRGGESAEELKHRAEKKARKANAPAAQASPTPPNRKPEPWMSPLWRAICDNDPVAVTRFIAGARGQTPSLATFVTITDHFHYEFNKAKTEEERQALAAKFADEAVGKHELQHLVGTGGRNALTFALEIGASNDVIKAICENSADEALINMQDGAGETPLIAAVRRGSLKQVKLLVKSGANLNAASRTGITPLYEAATTAETGVDPSKRKKAAEIRSYLESKDAKRDYFVHIAAQSGNAKLFQQLVDSYGENPFKPDESGKTPLELAEQAGHEDISDILKDLSTTKASLDVRILEDKVRQFFLGATSLDEVEKLLVDATLRGMISISRVLRQAATAARQRTTKPKKAEKTTRKLKEIKNLLLMRFEDYVKIKLKSNERIDDIYKIASELLFFEDTILPSALAKVIKPHGELIDQVRAKLAEESYDRFLIFNLWFLQT